MISWFFSSCFLIFNNNHSLKSKIHALYLPLILKTNFVTPLRHQIKIAICKKFHRHTKWQTITLATFFLRRKKCWHVGLLFRGGEFLVVGHKAKTGNISMRDQIQQLQCINYKKIVLKQTHKRLEERTDTKLASQINSYKKTFIKKIIYI